MGLRDLQYFKEKRGATTYHALDACGFTMLVSHLRVLSLEP